MLGIKLLTNYSCGATVTACQDLPDTVIKITVSLQIQSLCIRFTPQTNSPHRFNYTENKTCLTSIVEPNKVTCSSNNQRMSFH